MKTSAEKNNLEFMVSVNLPAWEAEGLTDSTYPKSIVGNKPELAINFESHIGMSPANHSGIIMTIGKKKYFIDHDKLLIVAQTFVNYHSVD